MKFLSTLTTIVILFSFGFGQSEELPQNAGELMRKLQAYEKELLDQANRQIAEKRSQVVAALEVEMKKATAAQDLDGAIAIREAIESLQQTPEENSSKVGDGVLDRPKSERELADWIIGKEFKTTLDNRIYRFINDTEVVFRQENAAVNFTIKYSVTSRDEIEIHDKVLHTWTFSDDYKEVSADSTGGMVDQYTGTFVSQWPAQLR